jgi:hypothetical protein
MILIFLPSLFATLMHKNLELTTVYNHAYQENYTADSMTDIIKNAKNAYVLIDPFVDTVTEYIPSIKSNKNQVAGYISAGTGEDWRDDFGELEIFLSTKVWGEWAGEYYISNTIGALSVMKKRIDKMASWGLDWVEFDNMDWLNKETKLNYNLEATEKQAHRYINDLCDYTHTKKMKCMAKNTVENFENFDAVLYESYHDNKNWWDTQGTKDFLALNKPVIINHYNETLCDEVYLWYKTYYQNNTILFICEDKNLQKYIHYNQ